MSNIDESLCISNNFSEGNSFQDLSIHTADIYTRGFIIYSNRLTVQNGCINRTKIRNIVNGYSSDENIFNIIKNRKIIQRLQLVLNLHLKFNTSLIIPRGSSPERHCLGGITYLLQELYGSLPSKAKDSSKSSVVLLVFIILSSFGLLANLVLLPLICQ